MRLCLAAAILTLAGACSGNDTITNAPAAPVPPPAPATLDFSAAMDAVDAAPIANMALIVGDETGVVFTYEKGVFPTDAPIRVASASKLIVGLAMRLLVVDGTLALDDQPQDYISYWADNEPAGRSAVSLASLMAFTSGFENPPRQPGCIGDGAVLLFDCVRQIHDGGLDRAPGAAFSYGPEHMQIAALMAAEARGRPFTLLVRDLLFDPLGVSADAAFPILGGDNPRFSGALTMRSDDYALILTALLAGDLVSDLPEFLRDGVQDAAVAFRPPSTEQFNADWRYGFGFWKECDLPAYDATCEAEQIISSPGGFGFTPWVDFVNGYWAIIAMEEIALTTAQPTPESVALEQALQPILVEALSP
ncbi:MAG: serine hydrolase domain-containing protein [Pseudomonadota bacterium]